MSDDTKAEHMTVLSETPARLQTEAEREANRTGGYPENFVVTGYRKVARTSADGGLEILNEGQGKVGGDWEYAYDGGIGMGADELAKLREFLGRDE